MIRLFAIAFACMGALAHAALPASAEEVGVAAAVNGSVSLTRGGAATSPRSGDSVHLADHVRTAAASGMQVLLLDESIFTIGENADLEITRYVYDPNAGTGAFSARLARGALRFVSGRIPHADPTSVTLSTPSATIGSRGTSLDILTGAAAIAAAREAGLIAPGVTPDPATASLVVLRGPSAEYGGVGRRGRVIVTSGGVEVEVSRPGYGIFSAGAGVPPYGPAPIPDAVSRAVIAAIEARQPQGATLDLNSDVRDSFPSGLSMFEVMRDGEPGLLLETDGLRDSLIGGDRGVTCSWNCHSTAPVIISPGGSGAIASPTP